MAMNKQQQQEFKLVKRRLSAIQKIIKMDFKDGQLPRAKDTADFVATSEDMDRLCQNEWQTAVDAYMDWLKQFQTAIAGADLQAASDAFQRLLNCKISCHKEFRQK